MDKIKLIEGLKKGLRTEESSIKIYTHHITQAATRSNLPDAELQHITEILTKLKDASIGHKTIVSSLIEKLQKDPRNDI
jgi:hypothetical protein